MAAEADKRQGGRTVRGMVPSLAVVLLAAGFIYLFVPHDEDIDPVKPVGYRVELDSARRAAPYPVLAPQGLPKTWRATSVTYEAEGSRSADWHLGFMTPDTQYAAVEQSDATRSAKYIEDVTQGARRTGETTRVNGQEWTRYEGGKYDALVREVAAKASEKASEKGTGGGAEKGSGKAAESREARHTVVVTGTASFKQLGQLAAALGDGDGNGGGSARR